MFAKLTLVCLSTVFVFSESAFVDTLIKCQLADTACSTNFLQHTLGAIGSNGVSELKLPAVDPVKLSHVTLTILDTLDITLIDGIFEGMKSCVINKFGFVIKQKKAELDMTCNFKVTGKYTVFSASPVLRGLTGANDIHGKGNGKVEIDKLNLKLNFFYEIVKKGDELFLIYKEDKTTYKFKGPEKVVFDADNLYIGEEESSKKIVEILNENWKTLLPSFSESVMKKAVDMLSVYVHNFFDKVSTSYFITDDLSSFFS